VLLDGSFHIAQGHKGAKTDDGNAGDFLNSYQESLTVTKLNRLSSKNLPCPSLPDPVTFGTFGKGLRLVTTRRQRRSGGILKFKAVLL